MFLAAAPIIFSVFLFIVFDLDTSSPRKNMLIEDKNLAVQLDKLNNLFNTALTHRQAEEKPNMSDNDQSSQQNVQTQQPPKQPPSEPPKKPKPQMSTEDFHAPMDKSKLLNENGK